MIKDRKFKEILKSHQSVPIDAEKKNQAIAFVMRKVEQTEFMPEANRKEIFFNQLHYMAKSSFLIQILITAAGMFLLAVYGGAQLQQTLLLLSSALPVLGIVSCTEIQKSFLQNMWELECACRYDLHTIISVRMILLSGANLIILTLFSVFGSYRTQTGIFRTAVYLLVPFLLMNLLFFLLLRKRNLSKYGLYTAGLAATLLFLFLSNTELQFLYERGSFAVWLVLLVAAAGFLAAAVHHFMKSLKEDTVVWSLQ